MIEDDMSQDANSLKSVNVGQQEDGPTQEVDNENVVLVDQQEAYENQEQPIVINDQVP